MRILVVEDEEKMASLLERGLQEEGHAVDVVATGPEAVWLGSEAPYDAVVLDLMLPGFDGLEVCRQLRAADRWAPILLLTARNAVEDRVAGLDAGADDYLTKPFSFSELNARIRSLARRGAHPRPTVLTVGDLCLDPATRRVWRGDAEVHLSPTEYAILDLFMRNPGEVMTRTRIREHVWDFSFDAMSNVVDQYVGYLRKKIDRPFGREDIETVRGVGYRLRRPRPI